MRQHLLFAALLAVRLAAAQVYIQNELPAQKQLPADDCYNRNLDRGNAALLRGETNAALGYFSEAKNCPEALNSTRRQAEIESRIERCKIQLKKPAAAKKKSAPANQARALSSEGFEPRRNYPANRGFLKDTTEDCFANTVAEADRAFRLRFWEDAAALYRAAKNCRDADQTARQQMTEKINACRDAAVNELFSKQQEAERQARHAIAANLADDAQELLQNTDRALAFRLADFANQYIAPDDNADCVQALFDAWYYQPNENNKHSPGQLYRPALCYKLDNNLGDGVQIRFQEKDGRQLLWAFVPKTGDIFAWEMPGMRRVQSYGMGGGYAGFDFSPAGDLLFWGEQFFEIRRGRSVHRVNVPSVANWCFNARGDEFFFENTAEQKIYVLNVREALAQNARRNASKGGNSNLLTNTYTSTANERPIVSSLPDGLLALRYEQGKFWLGFRNRIEVLSKTNPGTPWRRERVIPFEGVELPDYIKQRDLLYVLYPKEGFAVLGFDYGTWILRFDDPSASPAIRYYEGTTFLAASAAQHRFACRTPSHLSPTGRDNLWVFDTQRGDTLLRQNLFPSNDFGLAQGAFSGDGNWLAAKNPYGPLNVWDLQNSPNTQNQKLPEPFTNKVGSNLLSPGGEFIFSRLFDTLAIFRTSAPEKPLYHWVASDKFLLNGVSAHWALLQASPDTAEALRLNDGRRLRFALHNPDKFPMLYAFDNTGDYLVAYLTDFNTVEVRSLKSGALIASRIFDAGYIEQLHFLPGSDDLMIVQNAPLGEGQSGQSTIKLWSPMQAGDRPKSLRLNGYYARYTAVDDTGKRAAFSDGNDIRIFDLNNPENEALKIRTGQNEYLLGMTFRPNTKLLAAFYTTGRMIFWDTRTGRQALQLQVYSDAGINSEFQTSNCSIQFSNDGSTAYFIDPEGRIFTYTLDPYLVRTTAQNESRQLQSFEREHIVRYGLETALYYPDNFERLAESGDAPLISSFFVHFRAEAVESNNIERVRDYCERAFYLYERLDPNSQEIWRYDVQSMYEDYSWKLLLRGKIEEAAALAAFIKKEFGQEPQTLNAYIALLNHDCARASAAFSKYFLFQSNGQPSVLEVNWPFDAVEKELLQLESYELLDSAQINCFCGAMQLAREDAFATICPDKSRYPEVPLPLTYRRIWKIDRNRWQSSQIAPFATRAQFLEDAYLEAQALTRQDPATGQIWSETMALQLAALYQKQGVFERTKPEAPPYYEKAIRLLDQLGAFKVLPDTSRLAALAAAQLMWAKYLIATGKIPEAVPKLDSAFYHGALLASQVSDTALLRTYYDNLIAPTYENMGTINLWLGETALARQAYELANQYYTYGLHELYLGNVSLLEGDTVSALLAYGNIRDASQAAEAFFEIDWLAERFPEQRERLLGFSARLREALQRKNRNLVNAETDYWLASTKTEHFAALNQHGAAAEWSREAMQQAERCYQNFKSQEWFERWMNGYLNLPYYLLLQGWSDAEALNECIDLCETGLKIVESRPTELYYFDQELINTNLAHALVLRNGPGDRARATALYKRFLANYSDFNGNDNWDILQKDFRALREAGAPWPELEDLR